MSAVSDMIARVCSGIDAATSEGTLATMPVIKQCRPDHWQIIDEPRRILLNIWPTTGKMYYDKGGGRKQASYFRVDWKTATMSSVLAAYLKQFQHEGKQR